MLFPQNLTPNEDLDKIILPYLIFKKGTFFLKMADLLPHGQQIIRRKKKTPHEDLDKCIFPNLIWLKKQNKTKQKTFFLRNGQFHPRMAHNQKEKNCPVKIWINFILPNLIRFCKNIPLLENGWFYPRRHIIRKTQTPPFILYFVCCGCLQLVFFSPPCWLTSRWKICT